jgi:hypothetical protein
MALNMKANGKKINNMALEKRSGLMALSLKETTLTARNKEKGHSHGQMEAHTKVIFMKTIYMEEEFIAGLMAEYIMVLGNATKCMDMESLLGLMEGNMKANMLMIKNKGKECFNGQMAGNTLAAG